jgi:hypothetical protein
MSPQSSQPTAVIQIEHESFAREVADRIRSRMMHTVQGVIEIGRDLIAVKERLGHGNFLPWIDREFRMTDKSAERFMSVAERFGDKFDSVSNLSLTALYELAAPSTPEEVRTEVAERAATGESVTAAEVKELKNRIKEERKERTALSNKWQAAEIHNKKLSSELQERDVKIRELTKRLGNASDELRRSSEQGAQPNHEPIKAPFLSLWNVAPEEIKAWFLELATKSSH